MAKTSDEEIKNILNGLKSLGKNWGAAEASKSIGDLEKAVKGYNKDFGDSTDSLEDIIKNLEKEVIAYEGSAEDIDKATKQKALISREMGKLGPLLETTRKYLLSMRGGLGSLLMQVVDTHPLSSSVVNIFDSIISLFSKMTDFTLESNAAAVRMYASTGSLDKLDIGTISQNWSWIKEDLNKYGIASDKAEAALEAYVNASKSTEGLQKPFKMFSDNYRESAYSISSIMAMYAQKLGLSIEEVGTFVGDLQYSFGLSKKESSEILAITERMQKLSGIHSTGFYGALKEATEQTYLFGDRTVTNSAMLAYFGSFAGSSGAALKMFKDSQEVPEDAVPLLALNLMGNTAPEALALAREIKDFVADQSINQKSPVMKELFSTLDKGMVIGEKGAKFSPEALFLLKDPRFLKNSLLQKLRLLYLSTARDDQEVKGLANSISMDLRTADYYFSKMRKMGIQKVLDEIKDKEEEAEDIAENQNRFKAVEESMKNLKRETRTTLEKMNDKYQNALLRNFGDKVTSLSLSINRVVDSLTNSRFLKDFFSPDWSTEMINRMLKDILSAAGLEGGFIEDSVIYVAGLLKEKVDKKLAEKIINSKYTFEEDDVANRRNIANRHDTYDAPRGVKDYISDATELIGKTRYRTFSRTLLKDLKEGDKQKEKMLEDSIRSTRSRSDLYGKHLASRLAYIRYIESGGNDKSILKRLKSFITIIDARISQVVRIENEIKFREAEAATVPLYKQPINTQKGIHNVYY